MRFLTNALKTYRWMLIIWVLCSWLYWIPGVVYLYLLLDLLVGPVVHPFDFLSLGPIGFSPIIPLIVLNLSIRRLEATLAEESGQQPEAPVSGTFPEHARPLPVDSDNIGI